MSGETDSGWPFISRTDEARLYWQISQALANKLDAELRDLATDADVSDAIETHAEATDPHGQYHTNLRGDARYLKPSQVIAGSNVTVDASTVPGSVIVSSLGGGVEGGAAVLDELTDVDAASPSDGDVLIWDADAAAWVAGVAIGAEGIVVSDTPPPAPFDRQLWVDLSGEGGESGESGTGGGTVILPGTSSPDAAVGEVGNYYIDRSAQILYGPKSATGTIWPVALQGSGGSPWAKAVDSDPMNALTAWTVVGGTWVGGGAYGTSQTSSTEDAYLRSNASMAISKSRCIRAMIRLGGSSNGLAGVAFSNMSGWGTGSVTVCLQRGTGIVWDRYGSGGGQFNMTVNGDTDYLFEVMESLSIPGQFHVFVNDTLVTTIAIGGSVNRGTAGMYCRNLSGTAWFRNVSIWSGEIPLPRPT